MIKNINYLLSLFIFIVFCFAFPQSTAAVDEKGEEENSQRNLKDDYESIKKSGEQWSQNVKEWIKTDIKKAGTWEYKIVTIKLNDLQILEMDLNKLGQNRWECFWVERQEDKIIMFFKRSQISYIRSIPAKEMLKLVPDQSQ